MEEEGGLPNPLDADPPGGRPPESDPPGGRPLQKADPLEAKLRSPVNRMTHASENITLPQTSFAGGKNGLKDFFGVAVTIRHCVGIKKVHFIKFSRST